MSRIGKLPIKIPESVNVTYNNSIITVNGEFGILSNTIPNELISHHRLAGDVVPVRLHPVLVTLRLQFSSSQDFALRTCNQFPIKITILLSSIQHEYTIML